MPAGRLLCALASLTLAGGALAQPDPAPSPFGAALSFLPPGYSERFSTGAVEFFSGDGRFGVRRFPLPLPVDVRLTLARVSAGMEAGLELRAQDTSFALGVFEPSLDADETLPRVPRFLVVHDPQDGLQAGVRMQGAGALSEVHLGYARFSEALGLRLLAEAGSGVQGETRSPFLHLEVAETQEGGGPDWHWNLAATARGYIFPGTSQQSLDLAGGLSWQPTPSLTLSATHFERLVWGTVALPDLNLAPDRVTALSVSYLPEPTGGLLRLDGASYGYTRHWLSPADNRAPLSASLSLDFGGSALNLAPRHDFVTGEWGLGVGYLYRFGSFGLGPRLDIKRLNGVTSFGVGLALGP